MVEAVGTSNQIGDMFTKPRGNICQIPLKTDGLVKNSNYIYIYIYIHTHIYCIIHEYQSRNNQFIEIKSLDISANR